MVTIYLKTGAATPIPYIIKICQFIKVVALRKVLQDGTSKQQLLLMIFSP